jgi:hypothetical protein
MWETGASGWFTIEIYYDARTYECQKRKSQMCAGIPMCLSAQLIWSQAITPPPPWHRWRWSATPRWATSQLSVDTSLQSSLGCLILMFNGFLGDLTAAHACMFSKQDTWRRISMTPRPDTCARRLCKVLRFLHKIITHIAPPTHSHWQPLKQLLWNSTLTPVHMPSLELTRGSLLALPPPNHFSIHSVQIQSYWRQRQYTPSKHHNTSSIWHIHPKDNHQLKTLHTHLTPCLLSAFKCLSMMQLMEQSALVHLTMGGSELIPSDLICFAVWWWTLLHLHGQKLVVDTALLFVICSYTSCIIHMISKYRLSRQAAMW